MFKYVLIFIIGIIIICSSTFAYLYDVGTQLATSSQIAGSHLAGSHLAATTKKTTIQDTVTPITTTSITTTPNATTQLVASQLAASQLAASQLAASNIAASQINSSQLAASNIAVLQLAASTIGTFNLANLNLLLWLDATDSQNMILSGNQVTTWKDKSGLNNHMTNTTSYPLTNGSVKINNLNVLDFTGTKFLLNTTMSFPTTYSIFIVGYKLENAGFSRFISSYTDGYLFLGSYENVYAAFTGGGGWREADALTPNKLITSPSLLGLTNNNTSTGLLSYYNGLQLNSKPGMTSIFNGILIGSLIRPDNYLNDQFINGYIGEIIICANVLSTMQRQQVESYLAWKWGLQTNLPNDHPYKNVRI